MGPGSLGEKESLLTNIEIYKVIQVRPPN